MKAAQLQPLHHLDHIARQVALGQAALRRGAARLLSPIGHLVASRTGKTLSDKVHEREALRSLVASLPTVRLRGPSETNETAATSGRPGVALVDRIRPHRLDRSDLEAPRREGQKGINAKQPARPELVGPPVAA